MNNVRNFGLKALGAGIGLRSVYMEEIVKTKPPVRWFEIIADDFISIGGRDIELLAEIRKHHAIIAHGVSMSIGSIEPLDMFYLKGIKQLLDAIDVPWYSDHLCCSMIDHTNFCDLIPLPFTEEVVRNVVERIRVVSDVLQRPFLVENITRYITVSDKEMSESEFISRIIAGADCGLLLDITNVYLNAQMHKFASLDFIKSLPLERVGQIHLSGWDTPGLAADSIIDSHDAPIPTEIWELFSSVVELTGPTSVNIERDRKLPSLSDLIAEAAIADRLMSQSNSG